MASEIRNGIPEKSDSKGDNMEGYHSIKKHSAGTSGSGQIPGTRKGSRNSWGHYGFSYFYSLNFTTHETTTKRREKSYV